jgi:hypothetical protein
MVRQRKGGEIGTKENPAMIAQRRSQTPPRQDMVMMDGTQDDE